MIITRESTGLGTGKIVARHATFAEAISAVEARAPLHLEIDTDHPDCADAFMRDHSIISIQPENFTA